MSVCLCMRKLPRIKGCVCVYLCMKKQPRHSYLTPGNPQLVFKCNKGEFVKVLKCVATEVLFTEEVKRYRSQPAASVIALLVNS